MVNEENTPHANIDRNIDMTLAFAHTPGTGNILLQIIYYQVSEWASPSKMLINTMKCTETNIRIYKLTDYDSVLKISNELLTRTSEVSAMT